MPPKIWRKRVVSKWQPPSQLTDDIDDGYFDYTCYGSKCVYRPSAFSPQVPPRDDIILFDPAIDEKELTTSLKLDPSLSTEDKSLIIAIVKKYWDCFCKRGVRRTILGFEFGIDTGDAAPVSCANQSYGYYEAKIIMEQIQALLDNGWIEECLGAWASRIVLAPKPHQEDCTDINLFIWRMCVSYRPLNAITKPFAYPMARCDDAVNFIHSGGRHLHFISVDARQGYHQISVKKEDREKLGFFAPNNKKYCYNVMPFGPMNAPPFYTCVMMVLRSEWNQLFLDKLQDLGSLDDIPLFIISFDEIYLGPYRIVIDSKTIIDDIILYSCTKKLLFLYLECICIIFTKYRVSFRLDKCSFLQDRVEFVGHDITSEGICPASSKFNLVKDWKTPDSGQKLLSFISFYMFYAKFHPLSEMKVKALRRLAKCYFRKPIPSSAWTSELSDLFDECKLDITSSPVLARFDPDLPVFLKTDWSASGMSWILMQPARDKESLAAVDLLLKTGENKFDLSLTGARLVPIAFGSRACSESEQKLHSFVGEAKVGRWSMSQNKKMLWGSPFPFYWLCDCLAMKEIFEYSGSIAQIARWAQEMLGYNFIIVHRSYKMMVDVDALNRIYGKRITLYLAYTTYLKLQDISQRPEAYDASVFNTSVKTSVPTSDSFVAPIDSTVLTAKFITQYFNTSPTASSSTANIIQSTTALNDLYIHSDPIYTIPASSLSSIPKLPVSDNSTHDYITCPTTVVTSIDDTFNSTSYHLRTLLPQKYIFHHIFTSDAASSLFTSLFPSYPITQLTPTTLQESLLAHTKSSNIISACFIPNNNVSFYDWIDAILFTTCTLIDSSCNISTSLRAVWLWVSPTCLQQHSSSTIADAASTRLAPFDWSCQSSMLNAAHHGDSVAADRILFSISHISDQPPPPSTPPTDSSTNISSAYIRHIDPSLNISSNCHLSVISSAPPSLPDDSYSPAILHTLDANAILDPSGPATEPSPHPPTNNILGSRFGIPFPSSPQITHIRPISNKELLSTYGFHYIPSQCINTTTLDNLLPYSIPSSIISTTLNTLDNHASFLDDLTYGPAPYANSSSAYSTSTEHIPPSPSLDWNTAYATDSDCHNILTGLQKHDTTSWSKNELNNISKAYHPLLRDGRIIFWNQKLVYVKCIFPDQQYLALIIVPSSLRQRIFDYYHAGPIGAHVGEYKTLFRIRLRYFWPGLRTAIKTMLKSCAHCQAYNRWKSRRSEVYFSWPVTCPFYIMHVDLWSAGNNSEIGHGQLMNAMCDLSQFIISTPIENHTAEHLAQLFMEQVILTFGMCAVIVVDADNSFRGVFEQMCTILKIHFWPLARNNHKGLSVEHYHRYLNKVQTIVGEERGTHATFRQTCKIAQYGWNCSPVEGLDVTRSMIALGRDLPFPFDMEVSQIPQLNDGSMQPLFDFLRLASNNSRFAQSIAQILIEERRQSMQARANQNKTSPPFQIGDVVKAHIQVKSNAADGTIGKLSYQVKGPLQITKDLKNGSFEVQRYGNPNAATWKYRGCDLYLLPPSLYPSNPLDTMDQRYIDFDHAPIPNPLKKPLRIEINNAEVFSPFTQNIINKNDKPESSIDIEACQPHILNPTLPPPSLPSPSLPPQPSHSADTLHSTIINSKDKLFFIQFIPRNTIRKRWYIIQVDLQSTAELDLPPNSYWCVFLAKHPSDERKSDETARWWPLWHEYTRDPESNLITYGKRVLFRPNITDPDPDLYIQWAEDIDLSKDSLLGPFDFEPITSFNRTHNLIPTSILRDFSIICESNFLPTPTFGNKSSHQPSTRKRPSRKRKQNI